MPLPLLRSIATFKPLSPSVKAFKVADKPVEYSELDGNDEIQGDSKRLREWDVAILLARQKVLKGSFGLGTGDGSGESGALPARQVKTFWLL